MRGNWSVHCAVMDTVKYVNAEDIHEHYPCGCRHGSGRSDKSIPFLGFHVLMSSK